MVKPVHGASVVHYPPFAACDEHGEAGSVSCVCGACAGLSLLWCAALTSVYVSECLESSVTVTELCGPEDEGHCCRVHEALSCVCDSVPVTGSNVVTAAVSAAA